jgi:thymidine kinase
VAVFKPVIDERYDTEQIGSHDANSLISTPIAQARQMLNVGEDVSVVGVDEAQFFDQELVRICEMLAGRGVRVIVAGLDMDYQGIPFGPMPDLLAVAEYITKVHAICPHCGNLATHSYRLSEETEKVVLGEKDKYEPRCRACFQMGNILDFRKK